MRTDPRAACANAEERWIWAFIHDAVAHPFMALTNWSRPALTFHDWTSHRAWPRAEAAPVVRYAITSDHLVYGRVHVREEEPDGIYSVIHGRRSLTVRVQARDVEDALTKGIELFRLQDEHEAARG